MKKVLFNKLLASVKESGAIVRGEIKPARVTKIISPSTRPYEELRNKMSPKARAAADKKAKKILARLEQRDKYKPVKHT